MLRSAATREKLASTLLAVLGAAVAASACDRGARRDAPAAAGTSAAPEAPADASRESDAPAPSASAPAAASPASPETAADAGSDPVPPVPATGPERKPCSVALIGDSLTDERVGGGGFVRYLRELSPKSHFVNYAKGGAMVNQMRRDQAPRVAAEGASAFTHVVVFGGVNDLYSDETAGRTVAKIQSDLSAIWLAAKARGQRIVAVGVAPWGGFARYYNPRRAGTTRELNAWILGAPARGEVDVAVDAFALLSCGDDQICPRYRRPVDDGLHFGKDGHEALGQALFEAEFKRCS